MKLAKIDFPRYSQSAGSHHYYAMLFLSGQLPEQGGIAPEITRCQADVMPEHCVCAPCRVKRGQRFVAGGAFVKAKPGQDGKLDAFYTRFEYPAQRALAWNRRKAELPHFTEADASNLAEAIIAADGAYDCQIQIYNPLTGHSEQYSRSTGSFGRVIGAARYVMGRGYESAYYPPSPGDYALRYAAESGPDGPEWETLALVRITEADEAALDERQAA